MSFLYPAVLLGALAIVLPIALHLLRRDVAPEVPFSAVRLLRRSPIDRTRRRRLRDLILLAARVTALALLAFAFARPYLTAPAATSGMRIVAVDRSFSMGAPGRFAEAVKLASRAIDDAGVGERIALIAFDDRAQVVAPPGAAFDAREALQALTPGFGATRYSPAIAKAVEVAAGTPAHVVIVSDLQRNGWEDAEPIGVPAQVRVELQAIGSPAANVAVTQLRVEAERAVATISNSGQEVFSSTGRLIADGRDVSSVRVDVPPRDSVDVTIPYRGARRGALEFVIDDRTGYPADNRRYAVLDPVPATSVLAVTTAGVPQSGLYLARALEAAEQPSFDVRVASGSDLSGMTIDQASAYAGVALLSTRAMDRRGRDLLAAYVRRGRGLLIAGGADVDASILFSAFGWTGNVAEADASNAALSVSDARHSIFRPFGPSIANLGQVRFERVWRVKPEGWQVIARFTDGTPALLERPEGEGRVLVFASDLDRRWNEFPLHPGFVPFVVESMRHLAGAGERLREYLVADAPVGAGPGPGVYQASDGRTFAVNVDSRESASGKLSADEFTAMIVRADAAEQTDEARNLARAAQTLEGQQNLWQYGLVLMLGVLVVESIAGRA